MIRNIIGSIVALLGAAAAVQSPFHSWYDGRLGRDYRVQDLFNGISGTSSAVLGSILLPFLFAALVAVAGVVLRSRWVVAVAGLIVLGFTVLWMVRQGQAAGGLTLNSDGTGLGIGVAVAAGGGVLLLLGALVMSGRTRGRVRGRGRRRAGRTNDQPYPVPGRDHPDTWPPTQEPGPSMQTSPGPEPEAEPYTGPDSRYDEDTRRSTRYDEDTRRSTRYDENTRRSTGYDENTYPGARYDSPAARPDEDTAQYPVQDEDPRHRRRP